MNDRVMITVIVVIRVSGVEIIGIGKGIDGHNGVNRHEGGVRNVGGVVNQLIMYQ